MAYSTNIISGTTCVHRTPSRAPKNYGAEAQPTTIRCYLAGNVHLQTEDDIFSFVNLMASHRGSRSSLHALRISVGKVGPATAAALVSLLSGLSTESSPRFTRLELDRNAEDFLSSSPELPGAFAELTTLKSVRIASVGKLGADMLLNMKSSLVAAELCLDATRGDDEPTSEEEGWMSNPIFLLQGSRNTLEKLKASWALTGGNGPSAIRYPSVRELDLDCVDVPLTYDYIWAFPNISTLAISSVRFCGDKGIGAAKRYRASNKDEQEQYGTWDALDGVSCSLLDAYLLALQRCSVSTLRLFLNKTRHSQESCERMLYEVLDQVRPTVLRLTMGSPWILLKPSLLSALSMERTRPFETLGITYEVVVHDTASIVQEALASTQNMWIPQELTSVPITAFELEIDCRKACAHPPKVDTDEEGRGAGADYFVDLDLRELAREFMCFIRTVRSVRVSLRGHGSRKDTFAMLEYESEDGDSEDGDASVGDQEEEYGAGDMGGSQHEVESMMIVEDDEGSS